MGIRLIMTLITDGRHGGLVEWERVKFFYLFFHLYKDEHVYELLETFA